MKHYWINLDKNKLRNHFMMSQFEKMGFENYRISAVTPDDFDELLVQKRPLTCKYPGCVTCEYEFACLCSHIKAMREGIKSGDDYFVILEDDIQLKYDINYKDFINDVPKDAEIVQMLILYGNTVDSLFKLYKNTGTKFIKWQYLLPSTGMYLISREGAMKLVSQFYDSEINKYNFSSSPYQIVADVLLYQTVNTYATTVPYCVPCIEMGSDIHPEHLSAHQVAINGIAKVQMEDFYFPFISK